MSDEIKALKSLIAVWEKKARQAEKMLTHLRAALLMLEKDAASSGLSVAKRRPKAPAPLFSAKYGKSASTYLRSILTRTMTLREIQETLAASGKTYTDQAVVFALKRMEKKGEIEPRSAAPAGSAAKYVYGPVRTRRENQPLRGVSPSAVSAESSDTPLHRRVG